MPFLSDCQVILCDDSRSFEDAGMEIEDEASRIVAEFACSIHVRSIFKT